MMITVCVRVTVWCDGTASGPIDYDVIPVPEGASPCFDVGSMVWVAA